MTNQNDNETRTAPPPDDVLDRADGNGHAPSAAERYELGDRVAVGGMGSVHRAKETGTGRDIAIKFLHEQHAADPGFVARFRDEARAAARVKHPNIVEVLDYGRWDDRYYIAMEYVEGEDLRHYINEYGAIVPQDAIEIMLQVTAAVEAAHKEGLVHGDLKPENILIRPDGTAKVVDFGLARAAAPGNVTQSAAALATAQYLAPEVVHGNSPSPASDVYALGVVLYELLAGRPPFSGSNAVAVAMQHVNERPVPPHEINSNVPPALEAIAMKALAKRPEQRYASAPEMRAALEEAQHKAFSPISRLAMQAGVATPLARRRFWFQPFAVGAATLAIGLLVVGLLYAGFGRNGPTLDSAVGNSGNDNNQPALAPGTREAATATARANATVTNTPKPGDTPKPTDTPKPPATATSPPAPTGTSPPVPTATSPPAPTATSPPAATTAP